MSTGNQSHDYLNDVIGVSVDIKAVLSSAIAKVDVARWLFRLSRVNADTCRPFVGDGSVCNQQLRASGGISSANEHGRCYYIIRSRRQPPPSLN